MYMNIKKNFLAQFYDTFKIYFRLALFPFQNQHEHHLFVIDLKRHTLPPVTFPPKTSKTYETYMHSNHKNLYIQL